MGITTLGRGGESPWWCRDQKEGFIYSPVLSGREKNVEHGKLNGHQQGSCSCVARNHFKRSRTLWVDVHWRTAILLPIISFISSTSLAPAFSVVAINHTTLLLFLVLLLGSSFYVFVSFADHPSTC